MLQGSPTAPQSVKVSDLFAGPIIPGLGLVALYLVYLVAVAILSRRLRPRCRPKPPPSAPPVRLRLPP
ncbi:MAG TPA: hypothetical protein VH678_31900 [Xanthobacteraceae bacterium]|jgi:TRAP-type mannitol/chloroaromatic compound transport system permease large subunit